jgi:hypothetical protein
MTEPKWTEKECAEGQFVLTDEQLAYKLRVLGDLVQKIKHKWSLSMAIIITGSGPGQEPRVIFAADGEDGYPAKETECVTLLRRTLEFVLAEEEREKIKGEATVWNARRSAIRERC